MGLSIFVPDKLRTMLLADKKTIIIIDNGTYKTLTCLAKNPGALGGRGFYSIGLSTKTRAYTNLYKIEFRDNMWIASKQTREGFDMFLLVKTKKGNIYITATDENLIVSKEDVRDYVKRLAELANNIVIHP